MLARVIKQNSQVISQIIIQSSSQENFESLVATWKKNNSKVTSSINHSVILSIDMQQAKLSIANFSKVFIQPKFAKQFKIKNSSY